MKNPSKLAQEFMEKGKLESINVIDAHTHMGAFSGFTIFRPDVDQMVEVMDQYNIDFIISAPHSSLFDPLAKNSEIEYAMKRYPDRVRGYFSINPNVPPTLSEIEDAFKNHPGYMGIKILPDYHKTRLDSPIFKTALKFADERKLLVLSHTWGMPMYDGSIYSSIEMIRNVLDEFKNFHFLMGHSVQGRVDDAIDIAIQYDNAYLELTDTYHFNGVIEKMCAKAGSQKVIFGTDLPWFDPAYGIGCILFARINDEEKINILRNNILRLVEK